jgi:hypothetical protein
LAGSTAGTAFTYVQLKKRGADVPTATWALATSGIISTTVLAVVLGVGAGVTGDGATSIVGAVAVLLGVIPIAVLLMSFRSPTVRAYAVHVAERVIDRLHRTRGHDDRLDAVVVSRPSTGSPCSASVGVPERRLRSTRLSTGSPTSPASLCVSVPSVCPCRGPTS